jgi:5'-methylthioadenosine phosphorylase
MLAITGGTSLSDARFLSDLKPTFVNTRYGSVYVLRSRDAVFLPRHGKAHRTPPHAINHRANMKALEELGADAVIGVGSSGSLKKSIKPGKLLVPDDYLTFGRIETYYQTEVRHVTPEFDEPLRGIILSAAKKAKVAAADGGVYAQTTGPRLETKAEVRFLADYADVVGMTMASEATLARELDLPYAGLCTVDNYAHGLADEKLEFKKIASDAKKNRQNLETLLSAVLEARR